MMPTLNSILIGFFCLIQMFSIQKVVYAQSYQPMLTSSLEWRVTSCFNGCITDSYVAISDTLINDKKYKVLDGYHYISRTFMLREDVEEQRVFFFTLNSSGDNKELLLYDFSLNEGDTTEVYNPLSPFPEEPGRFVVDSTSGLTLFDGKVSKVLHLTALVPSQANSSGAIWIERIGSTALVNTPGAVGDLNGVGELSCFYQDNELLYTARHPDLECDASSSTEDFAVRDIELFFFPSPAKDVITVRANERIKQLSIFSILGEQLATFPVNSAYETKCSIEYLSTGTYIIQTMFTSGLIKSQQFVINSGQGR
jgi:hypothetical protein